MKRVMVGIVSLLLIELAVSAHGTSVIPEQCSAPGIYGNTLMFSQRTGSELYAVDMQTKNDVWIWSSGGRCVRTQPTVVDAVAYIWAYDQMTHSRACAVDCKSGKSLWETPDKGWTFHAAAVAGDVVLFPVEAKYDEIHAFDRKSGKRLWLRTDCRMMLVYGGSVLATTAEDRRVALLNVKTGETTFETPLVNETYAGPNADCSAAGEAVIGCDGVLLKLSIPDRTVLWRKLTPKEHWIPTIHGNDLYLVADDDLSGPKGRQRLQLRSLADGSVKRKISVKTGTSGVFPVFVFGDVIVIASGGELLGVDRQTLKVRWHLDTGGVYGTSRDEKCVYVGGTGPYLWRIDAATGTKTWTYDTRTQKRGSPAH